MKTTRRCALKATDRLRFEVPLYTVAEAARIVDVPPTTLATWAKGCLRRPPGRSEVSGAPVITYVAPDRLGEPSIPLELKSGLGVAHALASRKLYTDGAELLFDYGESRRDTPEGRWVLNLVVIRSGQRVFSEVVEAYLRRIPTQTTVTRT